MPPPCPVFNRRGEPIFDLDDWAELAAPAAADQWRAGYSAHELARTWCNDGGLRALQSVLDLVDDTRNLVVRRGTAEAQTRFDNYGGPRQHDLLLTGEAQGGQVVVAIEGKVNESFGEKLAGYRRAARRRMDSGKETNALERLDGLTNALAGWTLSDPADESRGALRYQLFSAVAGTIAHAVLEGQGWPCSACTSCSPRSAKKRLAPLTRATSRRSWRRSTRMRDDPGTISDGLRARSSSRSQPHGCWHTSTCTSRS